MNKKNIKSENKLSESKTETSNKIETKIKKKKKVKKKILIESIKIIRFLF